MGINTLGKVIEAHYNHILFQFIKLTGGYVFEVVSLDLIGAVSLTLDFVFALTF